VILDDKEFEKQGERFLDIRRKIFISGTSVWFDHDEKQKVGTRFVTESALFIHLMFSTRVLGGQWAQRATRRAGGVTGGKGHPEITDMGRVWDKRIAD
jgi:hypothetical protein